MKSVCFKLLSLDENHASSRIRGMAIIRWLHADGKVKIFQHPNADICISFKRLKGGGGYRILDISDNHFWPEMTKRYQQLISDCWDADMVVCSTELLAEYARRYSENVVVIPDAIDPMAIPIDRSSAEEGVFLWYGNWGSEGQDLPAMVAPWRLESAITETGGRLVVVSNNRELFESMGFISAEYHEWSPETLYKQAARCSAIVIPIFRTPFTLAKSHNRASTAIAMGVPVIADSHPSYEPLGVCTKNWEQSLANPTVTDPSVLSPYHIDVVGAMWRDLLLKI